MGQLDVRIERKLPCNQNLEPIFPSVEPDLVSKSVGLRIPGQQNQLSTSVSMDISMILVPQNIGRSAGSFLVIILRTRVSDENWIGEGDVVQFLADFLLHFYSQDGS